MGEMLRSLSKNRLCKILNSNRIDRKDIGSFGDKKLNRQILTCLCLGVFSKSNLCTCG